MRRRRTVGPTTDQRRSEADRAGERDDRLQLFLHDVRTPLTVVAAALETLRLHVYDLDPKLRIELLERALQQAGLMRRLMVGYETLRRLETGAVELERERVDVAALLEELAPREESGVDVTLRLPPLNAEIDPRLTRDAVQHLIDNVLIHTPTGTGMTVAAERAGTGVLVTVEDDGPGVPKELHSRIFDAFERGVAPDYRSGLGLGLSLVRAIARLHGGDAWVEETPEGGARFQLLLR